MATIYTSPRKAAALLDVRKAGSRYQIVFDGVAISLSENEMNSLMTMAAEAASEEVSQ